MEQPLPAAFCPKLNECGKLPAPPPPPQPPPPLAFSSPIALAIRHCTTRTGEGSATLSMAYAGAQFTEQLLRAMMGHKGVVECCFTGHKVHSDVDYFSTMTLLGPDGAEEALPYGDLSAFEEANMAAMLPDLAKQIQKGIAFVTK